MSPENILVSFYKEKKSKSQIFSEQIESLGCYNKLGESIMISSIPEKVFKKNQNITLNIDNNYYLDLVLKNNPYFRNGSTKFYTIHHLVENYNFGNGNILQQIYRAIGLDIDIKPKGNLYLDAIKTIPQKIGIHIDGVSAGRFYGKAREIYTENLNIIQQFIDSHPEYSFIQFGQGFKKNENLIKQGYSVPIEEDKTGLFNNVEDFLNRPLDETLNKIAECEYFICLNSGFYHAAIALDIKTICIINLPIIQECYLPILVNEMLPCTPPYSYWDKNWLYPQAVHLHQDGENELVKKFSEENLNKAIHGDIYPFWNDKYLSLIHNY
jgi:hypothetical protein